MAYRECTSQEFELRPWTAANRSGDLDGDEAPKAIALPLLNNDEYLGEETHFTIHIDNVTHPDMRGVDQQSLTVKIEDDGDGGELRFVKNFFDQDEVIQVERSNGMSGATVVQLYQCREFTVGGCVDWYEVDELQWQDQDNITKTIPPDLLTLDLGGSLLRLADVSGCASIGDPSKAVTETPRRKLIVIIISAVFVIALTVALLFFFKHRKSAAAVAAVNASLRRKNAELSEKEASLKRIKESLIHAQKIVNKVMEEGGSAIDCYSINYNDIELGKPLGEGSFGTVHRGILRGDQVVAVKMMRTGKITDAKIRAFKSEITIMAPLRHPVSIFSVVCTFANCYYFSILCACWAPAGTMGQRSCASFWNFVVVVL